MPTMTRKTVLQLAAAGFVLSYLVPGTLLGPPPAMDDDAATVVAWLRDNGGDIRLSLWVGIFGVALFAVATAIVRSSLPSPHRDVFFFGAVTFVAATTIQGWMWAGMARHVDTLDPQTARTLLDISSYWGPFLCGATVLTLAPLVVAAFGSTPVLPRWVGLISAVALVEQLVETVTIFGDHGFLGPGGPMNLILGAGLTTMAWVSVAIAVAREPNPVPVAA
jgi:hypothetical protein